MNENNDGLPGHILFACIVVFCIAIPVMIPFFLMMFAAVTVAHFGWPPLKRRIDDWLDRQQRRYR
ncbi:hypothetical protein [Candidatus Solirubrobacter pratensis]|uniref:hypothetical protein n=1 Tax=Candidatus Solirubrobacter pratensis TaxID=1298857 RepID=UPI00041F1B45|nr:hypothetical protein [Candidatus Solirubrobacter pratensis]